MKRTALAIAAIVSIVTFGLVTTDVLAGRGERAAQRREERQDARKKRRQNRQDNRQDRREARKDRRQDRRENRQENRQDRREARKERREERRGGGVGAPSTPDGSAPPTLGTSGGTGFQNGLGTTTPPPAH
jgi:hypothetical protein